MPVLPPPGQPRYRASELDLVGTYSADGPGVNHVALVRGRNQELGYASEADVYHVEPGFPVAGTHPVNVFRSARLTDEQRAAGLAWIFQVQVSAPRRWPPGRFSAIPAEYQFVSEDPDRPVETFYSCVGFVIACYREMLGTDLVLEREVPSILLRHLEEIYGFMVRNRDPRDYNKSGEPAPWRVILPGYLFHALRKGTFPHRPDGFHEHRYP